MTRSQLLHRIKEAIDRTEPLTEELNLQEINELDSMGWVSMVALYDSLFSITLENSDIQSLATVKELLDLASAKLEHEPGVRLAATAETTAGVPPGH